MTYTQTDKTEGKIIKLIIPPNIFTEKWYIQKKEF